MKKLKDSEIQWSLKKKLSSKVWKKKRKMDKD